MINVTVFMLLVTGLILWFLTSNVDRVKHGWFAELGRLVFFAALLAYLLKGNV